MEHTETNIEAKVDEVTNVTETPAVEPKENTSQIGYDIFNRTVELTGNTVIVSGNKTKYKNNTQATKAFKVACNKTVW